MRPIKYFLILITCIGLVACFHDKSSDVKPNQALSDAFNQVQKTITRTGDLINQQTENSKAVNTLSGTIGGSDSGSTSSQSSMMLKPLSSKAGLEDITNIKNQIISLVNNFSPAINKSTLRKKASARFIHDMEDDDFANDLRGDSMMTADHMEELLVDIFNEPTKDGNVYTYTLKNDFCDDETTEFIGSDCQSFAEYFIMTLEITSRTSGVIQITINKQTLLSFEYAELSLSLEVFLDGLKALTDLRGDDTNGEIPETFSGSFKLSIELLSSTKAEILASIPQAIDIDGTIGDEPITFSMASSSKLVSLIADENEEYLSLEFGMGALYAKVMSDLGSEQEIDIKALTGLFQLDTNLDKLIATNIGIGDSALTIDYDGSNAVTLDMATFGFEIDGSTEDITLTSDFDLALSIENVNGELGIDLFDLAQDPTDISLAGSLSITAPKDTVFMDMETTDFMTDSTKVVSGGPLSILGTGYYSTNVTVNAGECLISTDDMSVFGDGMSVTSC